MIRPLCLTALMLCAATAAQAQPKNCDAAQSTIDMIQCTEAALDIADADLNEIYQLLLGRLAERFSDDAALASKTEEALRAGQRAWITTRDNDCAVMGHAYDGGSLQPVVTTTCHLDATRLRTAALRDIFANYDH